MALTALITRPETDAAELAGLLGERGLEVLVEPMLTIVPHGGVKIDLKDVQALLFTSANGVRSFAAESEERDLPVLTVGDACARAARAAGFHKVASAKGDMLSLAGLAKSRLDPSKGPLFHGAGNVTAGDLGGQLKEAGFTVRKVKLYTSRKTTKLTPDLKSALKAGNIDLILFYSPRTAETFCTLVRKAKLEKSLQNVLAYCLSPAIADKLQSYTFKEVRQAPTPEQDTLLEILDQDMANMTQGKEKMATSPTKKPAEKPAPKEPATAKKEPEKKEPEKKAAPHKKPVHKKKKGGGGGLKAFMWLIFLLVIGGAIGMATLPWWHNQVPEPYRAYLPAVPETSGSVKAPAQKAMAEDLVTQRQTIADLEQRLAGVATLAATLQDRVTALESAPAPTPSEPGPPSADPKEIQALRAANDELAGLAADMLERLQNLEKSRVDAATVLGLSERVAGAEKMAQEATAKRSEGSTLILSAGQLKAAVDSGNAFEAELRSLSALAGTDETAAQAVESLTPYSPKGVATLAELRARFGAVSRSVSQAALAPEGDAWWSGALRQVVGLVTVKRTDGTVAGDGPMAATARAQAALDAGEVAKAVAEMESLSGTAADAASVWVGDAKARAVADAATSALVSTALSKAGG